MRRLLLILAISLVAAACGGSTTESSTSSSSTTSSTSTTSPLSTTSTTSTTTSTSTTTTSTTTTLAPAAPATGVIAAVTGVLGWSSAGEWMAIEDGLVPAVEGDLFSMVHVGDPVTQQVGGEVGIGCDFVEDSIGIMLDFGDGWPADYPVAVSADWPLVPHSVELLPNDNATYKTAASELLAGQGVVDPDPSLVQVIRTDLEGDGSDEIIVVAERRAGEALNPATPGDYSIAFMRKVVQGEVQSAILGKSIVVEPPDETWIVALDIHRVAAVVDLNGDGRMEIVMNGAYYEGAWTTVYDYIDDDLGAWPVLEVGCGA